MENKKLDLVKWVFFKLGFDEYLYGWMLEKLVYAVELTLNDVCKQCPVCRSKMIYTSSTLHANPIEQYSCAGLRYNFGISWCCEHTWIVYNIYCIALSKNGHTANLFARWWCPHMKHSVYDIECIQIGLWKYYCGTCRKYCYFSETKGFLSDSENIPIVD
jgi:hypothetical protein